MFSLYCLVEAATEIKVGELVVPKGATGTLVDIVDLKNKKGHIFGYYVEFTDPVHEVVSVFPHEIKERI